MYEYIKRRSLTKQWAIKNGAMISTDIIEGNYRLNDQVHTSRQRESKDLSLVVQIQGCASIGHTSEIGHGHGRLLT